MTRHIFRSICLVAAAVFLASMALTLGVVYGHFSAVRQKQLRAETALATRGVEAQGAAYLNGLSQDDIRFTWISADGTVLYDSSTDASLMENHLDRAEVAQALRDGYGESARYSATLLERLLYAAQRLPDGTVLRLSAAHSSALLLVLGMLQPMLVAGVVTLALALFLASRLSRRIVEPLNRLNLDDPLANDEYEEISPLLRRIHAQQQELRARTAELTRRRGEFDAVTENLREGLVLLDGNGLILSLNRAAAALLRASPYCVGQDILTVNRSLALQELLKKAQSGAYAETTQEMNGAACLISVSPVPSDDAASGCALLLCDVTEREKAEQMRREFTANVSHELKTPLHSISGCAEMLLGGMVKPEDTQRFVRQIYDEARRVTRLVEDIIRLSRLDEGAEGMRREAVDLFDLAGETVRSLASEAERAHVTLTLTGESAPMIGIPQLLGGIVYNLCDNAIKYNRENGRADVSVRRDGDCVEISVRDTGIGIPPEHQARVFERFYRVDKSRSREIGGTGLGLSIVKHAAQLHDARVTLVSTPEKGTCVTVRFPKGAAV